MKKLKLNLQQFEGAEVLTRSQLKKVLGGDVGSGDETCNCNSKDDCGADAPCCVACTSTSFGGYAGVCHTECA
jgi:hypothetical protein